MQYQKKIRDLEEQVENLKKTLQIEREEYKDVYKRVNCDMLNSSNFVNEEYYIESQYIHSLKQQIINLINHNDTLKSKNRELIEIVDNLNNIT